MHDRGPGCGFRRRSRFCGDLLTKDEITVYVVDWVLRELTSGLVLASDWVEHFRNLLQLDIMTLSVTDHDGLNQTVHILQLGREYVNGAIR